MATNNELSPPPPPPPPVRTKTPPLIPPPLQPAEEALAEHQSINSLVKNFIANLQQLARQYRSYHLVANQLSLFEILQLILRQAVTKNSNVNANANANKSVKESIMKKFGSILPNGDATQWTTLWIVLNTIRALDFTGSMLHCIGLPHLWNDFNDANNTPTVTPATTPTTSTSNPSLEPTLEADVITAADLSVLHHFICAHYKFVLKSCMKLDTANNDQNNNPYQNNQNSEFDDHTLQTCSVVFIDANMKPPLDEAKLDAGTELVDQALIRLLIEWPVLSSPSTATTTPTGTQKFPTSIVPRSLSVVELIRHEQEQIARLQLSDYLHKWFLKRCEQSSVKITCHVGKDKSSVGGGGGSGRGGGGGRAVNRQSNDSNVSINSTTASSNTQQQQQPQQRQQSQTKQQQQQQSLNTGLQDRKAILEQKRTELARLRAMLNELSSLSTATMPSPTPTPLEKSAGFQSRRTSDSEDANTNVSFGSDTIYSATSTTTPTDKDTTPTTTKNKNKMSKLDKNNNKLSDNNNNRKGGKKFPTEVSPKKGVKKQTQTQPPPPPPKRKEKFGSIQKQKSKTTSASDKMRTTPIATPSTGNIKHHHHHHLARSSKMWQYPKSDSGRESESKETAPYSPTLTVTPSSSLSVSSFRGRSPPPPPPQYYTVVQQRQSLLTPDSSLMVTSGNSAGGGVNANANAFEPSPSPTTSFVINPNFANNNNNPPSQSDQSSSDDSSTNTEKNFTGGGMNRDQVDRFMMIKQKVTPKISMRNNSSSFK